MKKLIQFSLIVLYVTLFNQVFGQSMNDENTQNYITLTRNVQQLKPILLAAEELAKEDGSTHGIYEIVICGQTVTELVKPEVMDPLLALVKSEKVKVIACGFSLKKFGVDTADIPKNMEVVQNGILHGFQRQKQGFYMISL